MTIGNFAAYTGASGDIVFVFYGTIPDETNTTPIIVTSYNDSTDSYKLDENTTNAS